MTELRYNFLKPYRFNNGVVVKNRIVIPPMTEASAFEEGSITRDELRYFRIHSGGTGLFISPVANVSENGKGFEGELSITDDRFLPGLTRMASAMKQNGTKAILQILVKQQDEQFRQGLTALSCTVQILIYCNNSFHLIQTVERISGAVQLKSG